MTGPRPTLGHRLFVALLIALGPALLAAGCGRRGGDSAAVANSSPGQKGSSRSDHRVVHPERRDLHIRVVQPGTVQAYETTPIYSRISGYIQSYKANIGDHVKSGDTLLEMWVPDLDEALIHKQAVTRRAEVQIRVAQSAAKAAESRVRTADAQIALARAGVKRAQASYDRWESELKRLTQLVSNQVLNQQVRDETKRQFDDAAASRDPAAASVDEAIAERDRFAAEMERTRADIDAARADLVVARADESQARVNVEFGKIRAPYAGTITQRNISPGDYLQPGGGNSGSRPLFVLEQTDPVRVFVGVPELAAPYLTDNAVASIRAQASPGSLRRGKVLRSGFSLNPITRTLQTEIDIPNAEGSLRPGMYVTATVAIDRKQAWTVPSNAVSFRGGHAYTLTLRIDGKAVVTPVLVGPADDSWTEILFKRPPRSQAPDDWVELDGREEVMIGALDNPSSKSEPPGPSGSSTSSTPSTPR